MNQWWLARDGQVYGAYQIVQLRDMHSRAELASSDQFCLVDTESWIPLNVFIQEHLGHSVIGQAVTVPGTKASNPSKKGKDAAPRQEKASTAQKAYMRALGIPITADITMAEARRAISTAIDGGARERLVASQHEGQRLDCVMRSVNGGGSCDRGYGHPLKYVKKEDLQVVVDWLDTHYVNWDRDAWKLETDPFIVYDKWLMPAVAYLYPELVKDSYRDQFGKGKTWHSFGG